MCNQELHVFVISSDEDLMNLFDMDDIGFNGEEYLDDDAKAAGFKTNADFFISRTKDIGDLISDAMRSSFYLSYFYEITEAFDKDGKPIKIVSLAYVTQ